jgi:hypothetical protein
MLSTRSICRDIPDKRYPRIKSVEKHEEAAKGSEPSTETASSTQEATMEPTRTKLEACAEAVRTSAKARGRSYQVENVDPRWVASEIAEFCKSKGWGSELHSIAGGSSWLVLTDKVAAVCERSGDELAVKISDLNPVMLKTVLTGWGLASIGGLAPIALPLAGLAVWKAQSRKAKVEAIVQFVDGRVQSRAATVGASPASRDIADRMKELGGLRDQGLISSEEYEAKKQELIRAL